MSSFKVWVCPQCTLENPFEESVCRACRFISAVYCRHLDARTPLIKEYSATGQLLRSYMADEAPVVAASHSSSAFSAALVAVAAAIAASSSAAAASSQHRRPRRRQRPAKRAKVEIAQDD